MIDQLKSLRDKGTGQHVGEYELSIVLGVSEGIDNLIYHDLAKGNGIGSIMGSEEDVQFRLLQCAHLAKAEIILRLTTESPFTAWEYFPIVYQTMIEGHFDLVTVRDLPDGSSFELISSDALQRAHDLGDQQSRTELCTQYLFRHPADFRMKILDPKPEHKRWHYRLTVDHPDDLMVCRKIFDALSQSGEFPDFDRVIKFLDQDPALMEQLAWIDGAKGRSV
jgi:spore coat polysaccharide biosynthesis protein SpsF